MQRCSTFRWDISRQEQLASGVETTDTWPMRDFLPQLRECSAGVFDCSQGADLVFVGRSPESLFDYLSGVFAGTPWAERCKMLNVSIRDGVDFQTMRFKNPSGLANICKQFQSIGVSPQQIVENPNPTAFVDLVCEGGTFGELAQFLLDWADAEALPIASLKKQIRFVGIVIRGKSSPKAQRWWQDQPWTAQFAKSAIKNISVDVHFWRYLGNTQQKVCQTNPPCSWSHGGPGKRGYSDELREALQFARTLYEAGNTREERYLFSGLLASQRSFRQRWCRQLVSTLRGNAAPPTQRHTRRRKS